VPALQQAPGARDRGVGKHQSNQVGRGRQYPLQPGGTAIRRGCRRPGHGHRFPPSRAADGTRRVLAPPVPSPVARAAGRVPGCHRAGNDPRRLAYAHCGQAHIRSRGAALCPGRSVVPLAATASRAFPAAASHAIGCADPGPAGPSQGIDAHRGRRNRAGTLRADARYWTPHDRVMESNAVGFLPRAGFMRRTVAVRQLNALYGVVFVCRSRRGKWWHGCRCCAPTCRAPCRWRSGP
jgi:hypothetical protein